MKIRVATVLVGMMVGLVTASAEEPFSKAIRPEDFASAELNKLSPEALARLDELVQAYKSGAVAAAKAEAEAQAAKVAAEKEKEQAKAAKASSPGFFAKAKVLLVPGTEIEYSAIEDRIAGTFEGWGAGTIFVLKNGQRWRVANSESYYSPAVDSPKVKIEPAKLGGFWLHVEGVSRRVKVLPVGQ